MNHANELVAHVRYANSIYPTNQLELDERILQLKFAIGSCETLSDDLETIRHNIYVENRCK